MKDMFGGVVFTAGVLLLCACDSSEESAAAGAADSSAEATEAGDEAASSEAAAPANCFQKHLQDAIALNTERKPLYSALTEGTSEPLSDRLVQSEQLGLAFAKGVDEKAIPYQAAGVGIVCDDFVSMSLVPAFRESFSTPPPPLSDYKKVDAAALKTALKSAYDTGGFSGLAAELRTRSESLAAAPSYNCMTRHLIDSLLRIATYAPVHDQRAIAAGMASTLPLSEEMVNLHLLTVDQAAQLDADAAPIQASGVPFLCQDVPPIEPFQP